MQMSTKKEKFTPEVLPPVIRTSAGLRDALFDELDRMRCGKTNATNANAVARLAGEIVNTVTMELAVHKQISAIPGEPGAQSRPQLPSSIGLGERHQQAAE
jgi:hypothetical protein